MKRLGVILALVAGCQPFGAGAQYQCVTSSDCDGTAFPVCDAAKHLCVAGGTATGSTTAGTTGSTTGASAGTTTAGGAGTSSGSTAGSTSGSIGTTGGPVVYPSFQGAAIKQLVPFDGGIFAVGTSLWFNDGSDGGAWTEVLNAPADAGSLLEIAENVYLSVCDEVSEWMPYDGFSLQRLMVEDGVLVAQIDAETPTLVPDAGRRGSNFYVECPTCTGQADLLGSDWQPLRQYTPYHFDDEATSAALNTVAAGSFFVYLGNSQSEGYTYGALTQGPGSSSTFTGILYRCGTVASATNGPAFLTYFPGLLDGGASDAGPQLTMLTVQSDSYVADAGMTPLPTGYRATPTQEPNCAASGIVGPSFVVSPDGGSGVVFVGGSVADGGTGVWAVPFGAGAAEPSFVTALPAGNLQLALGPGGVWLASGEGLAVVPLPSLTPRLLSDAPDTITALGQLGTRMLAGTGNGVLDITDLGSSTGTATDFTPNGLDGVELDAFGQGGDQLYALSGSGTQQTRLWQTSGGTLQLVVALDAGCQTIVGAVEGLLVCGDTVSLLESGTGLVPRFSPVEGQVVIQDMTTAYGLIPPNVVNVFNFGDSNGTTTGFSVLDGLNQPAVGPLWGSPAFGNGTSVYAYSEDGGFEILLATAQGGGATAALAKGGRSPVPGVAGTVDPLNGALFVLPDLDAGTLYDCLTTDGGPSGLTVTCQPLCQVQTADNGQIDLQFDVAGNLWVLSHVAVGAEDFDLIENASELYAIPAAEVSAQSSAGTAACPSVALSFITRPGDAPLDYVYVASMTMDFCTQPIPPGGPIQEGLLGFGVTPLDGGPIYFRGTRHPLACVPQVTDAGFSCALSIVP